MQEKDWEFLLRRIDNDECTPIIGPAVNEGLLPGRRELAESWAAEHRYPLPDSHNLARVAQFLAVDQYEFFPNDQMSQVIADAGAPDFDVPRQPHDQLAALNLPLYITTNYDDFLVQALQNRRCQPSRDFCCWNRLLLGRHEGLDPNYKPAPATPLVYYLHGHVSAPESLVLREDDYLDFLVHMAGKEYKLPPQVIQALGETSLLFIGYNPDDWEFRVLLRGLIKTESSLRRISVTAQFPLPADTPESTQQRAEEYLKAYFRDIDRDMRVYWGTASEFLAEIADRQAAGHSRVEEPDGSAEDRIDQVRLYHQMNEHFSREDLLTIAFEFDIDKGNLPEIKKSLTRELILELKNRQRLTELIDIVRRERPMVEW
ncbi:MAG: SIR2 family protein [Chloroflexota bacterium]|jgi:hypothetical protein